MKHQCLSHTCNTSTSAGKPGKKNERKKPQNSVLNLYPGFMNVILGLPVDPAALANGLASAFVVLIMFAKEVKHQNKGIIMYPPGS